MDDLIHALTNPEKLWSRSEVLIRPCPVPKKPGIYVWYFKEIPPRLSVGGCYVLQGLTMLYLGISPLCERSRGNLYKRIRKHISKDASRSTLRKSLGCLLSEQICIRLKKVGGRIHFNEGEEKLSQWMAENAFVAWVVVEKPWEFEKELILLLNLPLNLRGNESHPYYQVLTEIRNKCKETALQ